MTEHACGHSDDDHDQIGKDLQEELDEGDITALVPLLGNEQFMTLLQGCCAEIFVRTKTWDEAMDIWDGLDKLIRDTMFHDKAEDSMFPVMYSQIKEANKSFNKLRDAEEFAANVIGDLDSIVTAEPERPQKEDDFPGFYL